MKPTNRIPLSGKHLANACFFMATVLITASLYAQDGKAARRDFEPTNLSVLTADGGVYSLAVCYDPELPALKGPSMQETARGLLYHPSEGGWATARKGGLSARLKEIYARGDVLYCPPAFENSTAMDFEIGSLRFFIRGKKGSSQEREIEPLHLEGAVTRVPGQGRVNLVAVLPASPCPPAAAGSPATTLVKSRLLPDHPESQPGFPGT